MNRRVLILSIPLQVFLGGCIFLYKGLFSGPRKLESVLLDPPVQQVLLPLQQEPVRQFTREKFTGQPFVKWPP